MAKQTSVNKKLTDKADAYLISQGFDAEVLPVIHGKARRLLASSLESELKQFTTLPPHERRAAEADLIETISMSLCTHGHSNVSGSLIAGEMEFTGCKTRAGREALKGIIATLGKKSKLER